MNKKRGHIYVSERKTIANHTHTYTHTLFPISISQESKKSPPLPTPTLHFYILHPTSSTLQPHTNLNLNLNLNPPSTHRIVFSRYIYRSIYKGFPPIKSLHLLTSLGMTPSGLGNFSLIHWAKSTAVLGSMNKGKPKSTVFLLIT